MTILVTRPQPDADATAAVLRARGHDVLVAPVLDFAAVPLHRDDDADFAGVIVTSNNALRDKAALEPLLSLPLFAVGEKTAKAARAAGFKKVVSADGDADALRKVVLKLAESRAPLLYLAGADLAHDLAGELGEHGFTVVTKTTYRMVPVGKLPQPAVDAFRDGKISAVLHYSRRSARAFAEATRTSGVEISALSLPQYCLSDAVAAIVRDSGAARVVTAAHPNENALLDLLDRVIGQRKE